MLDRCSPDRQDHISGDVKSPENHPHPSSDHGGGACSASHGNSWLGASRIPSLVGGSTMVHGPDRRRTRRRTVPTSVPTCRRAWAGWAPRLLGCLDHVRQLARLSN
jgi:hypothetical protein